MYCIIIKRGLFMKNTMKLIGFIVLMVISALAFTGCDNGTGSSGGTGGGGSGGSSGSGGSGGSTPTITYSANQTLTSGTGGTAYSGSVATATISPAGTITYALVTTGSPLAPSGLQVTNTGALTWASPTAGTHTFRVTASASGATSRTATWSLTIGTPGLAFTSISGGTAYEVSGGTATATNIVIPATHNGRSVTRIAVGGFANSNIVSVTIPASVTVIGDHAFFNCTSLETVTFAVSSQLNSIGGNAFQNCTSLTSITIPAGVTTISFDAFDNCTSLETVTFTAGSQLNFIGSRAFQNCTSLTSITIPTGVTTIASHAFSGTSLTSITIPTGVTTIGFNAFDNCTSLETVTVLALTPPLLGPDTFINTHSSMQIRVPAGSVAAYQGALNWSAFSARIVPITP
jgi:hypothetical protein